MLALSAQTKVFLCTETIDFRKGIDGLKSVCVDLLEKDPFSGMVFIFRNRRKNTIRVLAYDGQGFWLCTKRLSQGRFQWWPDKIPQGGGMDIRACDLQALLWNGNPQSANFSEDWKKMT